MAVRIIGGQYRRKRLPVPESKGLRPTSDRIRETLFNWLMHDIQGAVCLDLFAGSGALGFEAYSRGAQKVILVEKNKKVFLQLQKTAALFSQHSSPRHPEARSAEGSPENCAMPNIRRSLVPTGLGMTCVHQDALDYLKTTSLTFDILFLDPPFDSPLLKASLEKLETSSVLKPHALVYMEADLTFNIPSTWQCVKSGQAGRVRYGLYTRLSPLVSA